MAAALEMPIGQSNSVGRTGLVDHGAQMIGTSASYHHLMMDPPINDDRLSHRRRAHFAMVDGW